MEYFTPMTPLFFWFALFCSTVAIVHARRELKLNNQISSGTWMFGVCAVFGWAWCFSLVRVVLTR